MTDIDYLDDVENPSAPWNILPSDLEMTRLSNNARTVLEKRYLKRDINGTVCEQPEHMFWRVARFIAEGNRKFGDSTETIEGLARVFYSAMIRGEWLPNSPTLFNAGRPLGQLSACFVLPIEDSLSNGVDGIYDTLSNMARIHKSGGGTGFSFSRIREEGARVASTTGVASGPISFMRLYDASTDVVKQSGMRRGANMGVLSVDHPDIEKFVSCKADTSQITNFNISVAATDEFMGSVEQIEEDIHGVAGERFVKNWELFNKICTQAHATGEPGLFFIDAANRANPAPSYGSYEATNPCGEQPLLPLGDVCNLGSINLGKFVIKTKYGAEVMWNRLEDAVIRLVLFLDNVVELNNYPLPQIKTLAHEIRRIGLGVMGWADMLIKLGIPYDSKQALSLADDVASFIDRAAWKASERLADERGACEPWKSGDMRINLSDKIKAYGISQMRNCNVTTVAPTGTISIIAGCSGGIEPLFAVSFKRNQAGIEMTETHPGLEKELEKVWEEGWRGKKFPYYTTLRDYKRDMLDLVTSFGHLDHDDIPDCIREIFKTAHEIAPMDHVKMQAAWQTHIDSAISKTINLPHDATVEDVKKVYLEAWKLGCKGITVYRDGSRPGQVLSTKKEEPMLKKPPQDILDQAADKVDKLQLQALSQQNALWQKLAEAKPEVTFLGRPPLLRGTTIRQESPLGTLYLTINEDASGTPVETFCTIGKAGAAAMADAEAMGRLMSLSLKNGASLSDIYEQLRGIACDQPIGFGPNKVLSAPDAIAQAIGQYLEARDEATPEVDLSRGELSPCPDCGGPLQFSEGCKKCHGCGYSACG